MLRSARGHVALVLGVIMVALGAWLLVNSVILRRPAVSGQLWLDAGFAALFVLRGVMNVRSARRIADALRNHS